MELYKAPEGMAWVPVGEREAGDPIAWLRRGASGHQLRRTGGSIKQNSQAYRVREIR